MDRGRADSVEKSVVSAGMVPGSAEVTSITARSVNRSAGHDEISAEKEVISAIIHFMEKFIRCWADLLRRSVVAGKNSTQNRFISTHLGWNSARKWVLSTDSGWNSTGKGGV